MFNKLLFTVSLLILSTSTLLAQQRMQDVVYLTDGSIIRGIIIEQVPNVSLKIQTLDRNVFVYSMDKISKITKEPFKDLFAEELSGEKSPGLAFALSLLLPGCGQYYNGDISKGVIQDVLWIGGNIVAFAVVDDSEYWESAGFWITWSIANAAHLWSMIDALVSANKINERRKQYYGHLIKFNNGKNVIGFDLGPTREGFGAQLSYHF